MSEAAAEIAVGYKWWGRINYDEAHARMVEAHADRVAGRVADQCIYLEHEPIITYGRATPPEDLKKIDHDIPTRAVARGGLATYHGPGQLVGYIIIDLAERSEERRPDIHDYLRALEEGIIEFLRAEFNLATGVREGFTGVWTVPDGGEVAPRKLASIGVNARKWVTTHGFALNIAPEMAGFNAIVPCGITEAEMTSIELELQRLDRRLNHQAMADWAAKAHVYILQSLMNAGWANSENKICPGLHTRKDLL